MTAIRRARMSSALFNKFIEVHSTKSRAAQGGDIQNVVLSLLSDYERQQIRFDTRDSFFDICSQLTAKNDEHIVLYLPDNDLRLIEDIKYKLNISFSSVVKLLLCSYCYPAGVYCVSIEQTAGSFFTKKFCKANVSLSIKDFIGLELMALQYNIKITNVIQIILFYHIISGGYDFKTRYAKEKYQRECAVVLTECVRDAILQKKRIGNKPQKHIAEQIIHCFLEDFMKGAIG